MKPALLTLTLFILQLALFLWITLRPFSLSPTGTSYYILHGQGAYTAYIRESKEGAWNITNPFTTRPNPAVYVQLFYVVLGKIAGVFSLNPVTAFMVTRVVAGLLLFLTTYWFIIKILPARNATHSVAGGPAHLQTLAVLFTLGLEPGPLVSEIKNIASVLMTRPVIFSYFPQEVVLRHFGLPHHVLAEVFGLFLLGQIFLYVKQSSWVRLAGIGLLAVTGTLIMPAYNVVLVATALTAWCLWAAVTGEKKKMIPVFIIVALGVAAAGLFTKFQMDASDMWKYFSLDEKRWVPDGDVLVNYLSSLVLYVPAAVFLWMTRRRPLIVTVFTAWIIGPLLFIPFTRLAIFPLANFRLVDGYAYVPAGILAAMGIRELGRKAGRTAAKLAVLCIIAVSLFLTVSYTRKTFADQERLYTNVYLLHQEWDALRYLSTIPKNSGVMTMKYIGEIIPVYAPARVFLGETPGALDWENRYQIAVRFYSGLLTDREARAILQQEHISYVYAGRDEKLFIKTPVLYPNVLVPVFQNSAVTIFAQKK